jgi:hypothetical protein
MMVAHEKTQVNVEQTSSDNFIPFAIEMYGRFHFCFDSFFTACALTTIVCHQQFSLVLTMFISYYKHHVSITLQCAQTITIL